MEKKGDIMGVFAKMREQFPIIKILVNAQKSIWYPVLFAILCVIAGVNDYTVYIPIMWVLVAITMFSLLFTDDNKVFLTPLCIIVTAIGSDAPRYTFYESDGELLSFMHPDALWHIVAMGIIAVGTFIVRLFVDGSMTAAFKKRRGFTNGIIAMDVAFLLGGIFSPTYEFWDFTFGALLAAVLTAVYFFVSGMLEKSEEPIKYGCMAMLSAAYASFTEIFIVVLRLHAEGKYIMGTGENAFINKNMLTLGWGVSTVVGAVFVLGIPAAMYLAKNCRASFIFYFSCPVFIFGTILVNTRGSMFVSIVAFIVCSAVCCVTGHNKKLVRIYAATSALLIIAGDFFIVSDNPDVLAIISKILRLDIHNDSGRAELWENGICDFKNSPLLGVGFTDGAFEGELKNNNFYSNMYHCIIIQWLGGAGVVGCVAFLIHLWDCTRLLFKKISAEKFILMLVPLMIIAMSLLDNFFFYPHFQIFYAIFLALAEHSHNKSNVISKGAD